MFCISYAVCPFHLSGLIVGISCSWRPFSFWWDLFWWPALLFLILVIGTLSPFFLISLVRGHQFCWSQKCNFWFLWFFSVVFLFPVSLLFAVILSFPSSYFRFDFLFSLASWDKSSGYWFQISFLSDITLQLQSFWYVAFWYVSFLFSSEYFFMSFLFLPHFLAWLPRGQPCCYIACWSASQSLGKRLAGGLWVGGTSSQSPPQLALPTRPLPVWASLAPSWRALT